MLGTAEPSEAAGGGAVWHIVRKGALLETDTDTIVAVREPEPAATKPRPTGGRRLSVWLMIFGSCLIVPALGFTGVLIERHWAHQQRETEQRLAQVANDLARDLDRFLTNMIATLSVIAETSDFSPSGLPQLHEQASRWLSPLGLYLVYREADGQQLLNTRLLWGTKLPREQLPELDQAVRATGRPHVSNVFRGAVAQQAIVTITAPVMSNGKPAGFLHLSIDPRVLLELASGQNLPRDWNTTISDRAGVIIMRLHHHDRYVGTALPDHLVALDRTSAGSVRTRNVSGEESIRASAISRVSGWLVSSNVPLAVARAPLVADMWSILGAVLVMLAFMLALAFTVAGFIARPIRDIAGFASLVEGEQVPPPLVSPVREANEVAASLRLASQRLKVRTGELRDALDRFNLALRGADIVVFAQDLDRRLTWISDSTGNYPPDIVGQREEDLLPVDSRSEAIALKRLALVSGRPQDRELKVGQGESARYFRVRVEPVKDETRRVVRDNGSQAVRAAQCPSRRRAGPSIQESPGRRAGDRH
jgi:two-component system, sensor histidine kinase